MEDINKSSSSCRDRLCAWHFDPDNVTQSTALWYSSPERAHSVIPYGPRKTQAMIVFAQLGDIPVMEFILQQCDEEGGAARVHAELHKTDEYGLFPLYMAISEPHTEDKVLKVCQYLHGKGSNLYQTVADEWSVVSRACLKGYSQVALWFVQQGALLYHRSDGSSTFAPALARRDLPSQALYNGGIMGKDYLIKAQKAHQTIFSWAKETLAINQAFWWVLRGTILPPKLDKLSSSNESTLRDTVAHRLTESIQYSVSKEDVSTLLEEVSYDKLLAFHGKTLSPLRLLSGHSGILQEIAAFAGYTTDAKLLCTARGLVEHESWWTSASLRESTSLPDCQNSA